MATSTARKSVKFEPEFEESIDPEGRPSSASTFGLTIFSDSSLAALSTVLGPSSTLITAMCLNVPTTALVNIRLIGLAKHRSDTDIGRDMMLYWCRLRASTKDSDRLTALDKALRAAGREDIADVVAVRYRNNQHLTVECLTE